MSKLAVTQVTAPINVSNDLLGKLTSYSTKVIEQQINHILKKSFNTVVSGSYSTSNRLNRI